jgi:hypothetical protein
VAGDEDEEKDVEMSPPPEILGEKAAKEVPQEEEEEEEVQMALENLKITTLQLGTDDAFYAALDPRAPFSTCSWASLTHSSTQDPRDRKWEVGVIIFDGTEDTYQGPAQLVHNLNVIGESYGPPNSNSACVVLPDSLLLLPNVSTRAALSMYVESGELLDILLESGLELPPGMLLVCTPVCTLIWAL